MSERTWDIGDPEPEGVTAVVDEFADDYGNGSPFWLQTTNEHPEMRWKGYKDGGKVYLGWDELVRRWGPVKEKGDQS